MELYLDSVDFREIEQAMKLGFVAGLTTTPTFMHREGITDIDGTILKLSRMVPILQVEALGETADAICAEAKRLLSLGLDPQKTVFKIPVSLEGVTACKRLTTEGIRVNIHLVYTLQQAYMAMAAGATYICPLVGRLQDQGHDALALIEQCVKAVNYYGYSSKIMFSSVRHAEHVRNAINLGVHACTVPWKVMKALTENNFTTLGTQQFIEHTKLITLRVKDIMNGENPIVQAHQTVMEALVVMTKAGFGAVTVVNEDGTVKGVFTDGDLRRTLERGEDILHKKMSELSYKQPITIAPQALLFEAAEMFKKTQVDTIVVADNNRPLGMIDVQDIVKLS
ncbi:MAG: transaldolase family protein [Cytophagales bacterium]|nr:CBS domain-containing protein [Bernardetiaceae bacterium]MDW8211127.1 transaldolase family protein [Cytophagales bacterium]